MFALHFHTRLEQQRNGYMPLPSPLYFKLITEEGWAKYSLYVCQGWTFSGMIMVWKE